MNVDIRHALKQARKSKHPRARHGAALFDGRGRLLSVGFNRVLDRRESLHAEDVCLRKIPRGAKNLTLVVVRVRRDGTLANSKPCADCAVLIKRAGVKVVVHS